MYVTFGFVFIFGQFTPSKAKIFYAKLTITFYTMRYVFKCISASVHLIQVRTLKNHVFETTCTEYGKH